LRATVAAREYVWTSAAVTGTMPMTALSYTARSSLFSREVTYGLDDGNLSDGDGRIVPLHDVVRVRTYGAPGSRLAVGGANLSNPFERCVVHFRHGPKIAFSSRTFLGLGRTESLWSSYTPFVETLVAEVRHANPDAKFIAGMPMRLWLFWLAILLGAFLVALVAAGLVLSLAIIRSTDVDAWILRLLLLCGALPGLTFYTVLRTGWPREYDPLKVVKRS
jgi:hypothetical protein